MTLVPPRRLLSSDNSRMYILQKDKAYLNSIHLAGVSTLRETTANVYVFKVVQYYFRPTPIRTFFENIDPTGFEYLTMNNEVRIQMEISNHFLEDSILNIMMLRLPILNFKTSLKNWMTKVVKLLVFTFIKENLKNKNP